eukprot:COSAG02_NODE_4298_length_5534_cov_111.640662_5_plen_74_part_00
MREGAEVAPTSRRRWRPRAVGEQVGVGVVGGRDRQQGRTRGDDANRKVVAAATLVVVLVAIFISLLISFRARA